ncbi:unnamed protein product [Ceratitis capitata]|uniref:(Mediterranean fruit fly) hypothetical protein n=1 Tax=Ceratitis capitata TaxID=7213 RepID=A0A811UA28_CERCA|nr:unnamed protein product [Ceratitis capitata]
MSVHIYYFFKCICVYEFRDCVRGGGIFLVDGDCSSSSGSVSNMLECCRCQLHCICFSATFLLSTTKRVIVFIELLVYFLFSFAHSTSFFFRSFSSFVWFCLVLLNAINLLR